MSVVVSKSADPRALVEASQAMRSFMGTPHGIPYARKPAKVLLAGAETKRAVPAMSRDGKRWTDGEFAILEQMTADFRPEVIAARLGRSRSSVCSKAWERNLSVRVVRNRATPQLDRQRAVQAQVIYGRCPTKMREIITAVSAERNVPIDLILSTSRIRAAVMARQHIVWRTVRDTSMSMSAVSLRLGLDHTTCRHAVIVEDRRQGTNVHATRAAPRKVQS